MLNEALETYKLELIERYKEIVRSQFERMVNDHGPALKGISNSWKWAKVYNNTVRANIRAVRSPDQHPSFLAPYAIDEEKLHTNATRYADTVIEAWANKIQAKLGELEDAHVKHMSGGTFFIHGTRHGRKIVIEQTTIINVSSKGTVFNQFPARIYVDGKFTSEAAFKKLTNTVASEDEDELDLSGWEVDEEDPDCSKKDAELLRRGRQAPRFLTPTGE